MARSRHRTISSFNLAFLDIMFCGFGAVVLLVLIVQANAVKHRKEQYEDLQDEVHRAALARKAENNQLELIKAELEERHRSLAQAQTELAGIKQRIERISAVRASQLTQAKNTRQQYESRKKELQQLQAELNRLMSATPEKKTGKHVRRFAGDGYRQYLTGLKLGGRRIALLVDMSASMLDETVVNILRRRNMSDEVKRNARKWQQAKNTIEWLVANMPAEASIQIITFNNQAASLGTKSWIPVQDASRVDLMLDKLRQTIPAGGTNLTVAFDSMAALTPRPDNCILLTDGLPTQGNKSGSTGSVSSRKRVKLFQEAIKKIPPSLPVNTILFPMEGDPMAASLYWQLAIETRGSFFTPTRDWP